MKANSVAILLNPREVSSFQKQGSKDYNPPLHFTRNNKQDVKTSFHIVPEKSAFIHLIYNVILISILYTQRCIMVHNDLMTSGKYKMIKR